MFRLQVRLHPRLAEFAPDAAHLHAAKRPAHIRDVIHVDADAARADVEALLTEFHRLASQGDFEPYFELFTPDAVFIGVNRNLTIETVRFLRDMGAGGAVCFASGFREAQAETGNGESLQAQLLDAAGAMPIIGAWIVYRRVPESISRQKANRVKRAERECSPRSSQAGR